LMKVLNGASSGIREAPFACQQASMVYVSRSLRLST
jgi:hypothetical protein